MVREKRHKKRVVSTTYFLFFFREQNLIILACEQLGRFLTHRDTNLRYVALEGLYKLASCENAAEEVKKHRQIVIKALKVSVLL